MIIEIVLLAAGTAINGACIWEISECAIENRAYVERDYIRLSMALGAFAAHAGRAPGKHERPERYAAKAGN
jgi:hypothetical protein